MLSVIIRMLPLFIFICASTLETACAKDMSMDAVFPPAIPPSASGLPVGHLYPLGCQRPADGPVKEYAVPLAPAEFWEHHIRDFIPLVYRQAVTESPAFTNWQSDEYIRETYGDLHVLVEKKNEDRAARPTRMSLSEFLDNYQQEDWYVVSLLPDPMRAEVQVPRSLLCGTFRNKILESNLWLSAGGTRSLLHYDADHNLHCLLSGRKDFIMIADEHHEQLDMAGKKQYSGSSFSHMDMDRIDLLANPQVAEVPWTWATLLPGDCILIPSGYFHQVRSYGRSVAATIMWDPRHEFTDSDCTTADIDKYTALSEVNLQWTYKKGDPFIDMGYMDVEFLRKEFLEVLARKNSTKFTKEHLAYHYEYTVVDEDVDGEMREQDMETVDLMFSIMDRHGAGYLTREELEKLDVKFLKDVARVLDEPHGPVTGINDGNARDEL